MKTKTRTVPLAEIVRALDERLRVAEFARDVSHNGLQIEGAEGGVSKVCCGVDASPAFYEEALRLLREHREALDRIAEYLIERETITGKEFMQIFREVEGISGTETNAGKAQTTDAAQPAADAGNAAAAGEPAGAAFPNRSRQTTSSS